MEGLWQWLWTWFAGRKSVPPPVPPSPQPPSSETDIAALVRLHNAERLVLKLPPLKLDSRLTAAAIGHAVYMRESGRLTHDGRYGSTFAGRAAEAGYPMRSGGENIAGGYTAPASVMLGWMGSTEHRRNIIDPDHRDIGVGRAGDYWCVVFGAEIVHGFSIELVGDFHTPKPLDGR